MERVRVKDNTFVGIRTMKIDMVDDTVLLNVVPFCKKDKDHHPKRSGAAHSDAAAFTIKTIDDSRTLNKTLYLKAAWKRMFDE